MTKNFTIGTGGINKIRKKKEDKQKLLIWNQNGQTNETSMKTFIVERAIK